MFMQAIHIWARNHALAVPSRFEGLPLALVEAMMCGRPAVVTDVAGNSEVIEDGVTGFLADAPTVRSMESALERFWAQRNDLERMGQVAAARIRQLIPPDPVGVFSDKIKELIAAKIVTARHRPEWFGFVPASVLCYSLQGWPRLRPIRCRSK
jgi:glycosyltransferase involved in cell wall biosynthesis